MNVLVEFRVPVFHSPFAERALTQVEMIEEAIQQSKHTFMCHWYMVDHNIVSAEYNEGNIISLVVDFQLPEGATRDHIIAAAGRNCRIADYQFVEEMVTI